MADMIHKSKIKNAKSEFSVKMDTNTGEITGFENFLQQLGIEERGHATVGVEGLKEGAKKLAEKLKPGDFTLI